MIFSHLSAYNGRIQVQIPQALLIAHSSDKFILSRSKALLMSFECREFRVTVLFGYSF